MAKLSGTMSDAGKILVMDPSSYGVYKVVEVPAGGMGNRRHFCSK